MSTSSKHRHAKDIDGETFASFLEAHQVGVARLATRYDGRGASRLKTMRKADRSIRESAELLCGIK